MIWCENQVWKYTIKDGLNVIFTYLFYIINVIILKEDWYIDIRASVKDALRANDKY